MKPKFFSPISDHQQSLSPRPFRGAFLMSPALLVVADCDVSYERRLAAMVQSDQKRNFGGSVPKSVVVGFHIS
ncbi:MAG: hypothetical protein V2J65_15035 [Desulfobacteraceae bacterium]|jgi:hypothetical protein|nr:hypothetical protein [Desulfobacteraceae bacterium]